jgi:hypothetical protein
VSKIVIDTSQLSKISKALMDYEKQMPGAAVSAVNRTLDYVNARVGKLVASEYRIKVKDVRQTITKHRARKGKLLAFLKSQGRRLTLGRFVFGSTKRAVRVKVKRNEPPKTVSTNPKPFVQIVNGRVQVMKRQGRKRLPVDFLRSISIPQMIDALNVQTKLQEEANQKLAERIEHEIDWRLRKEGAK